MGDETTQYVMLGLRKAQMQLPGLAPQGINLGVPVMYTAFL